MKSPLLNVSIRRDYLFSTWWEYLVSSSHCTCHRSSRQVQAPGISIGLNGLFYVGIEPVCDYVRLDQGGILIGL